jgi:hypothetical protein
MMDKERRWFMGIDWGSQEHVVSLCDEDGVKIGQRKFPHGGTDLTDMIAWLLKASGGKRDLCRHRDSARADRRGPARAQFRCVFHQSSSLATASRSLGQGR